MYCYLLSKLMPSNLTWCIRLITKSFLLFNNQFSFKCSLRVCSSNKMAPIYFLHLSKVWSMLHITGQWCEFRVKDATIYLHILFWYFVVVFHHKIRVFIDKGSNFCNRILTNSKTWICGFQLSAEVYVRILFSSSLKPCL